MKRKDLQAMYGAIPDSFQARVAAALDRTKEEKIVKRKIPVALVVALVLVLALGVAFALTSFFDYAQTTPQMERTQGYFEDWPAADKVKLVLSLADEGYMPSDARIDQLRAGSLDDEAATRLADEVITEWMDSPVEDVVFLTIMEHIWGGFSTWTLEQKAWYTQTMIRAGIQRPDHEMYLMPREGDIPMEEAVAAAKQGVAEVFDLPQGALDAYRVVAEYGKWAEELPPEEDAENVRYSTEGVEPVWLVTFYAPEDAENPPFDTIWAWVDPVTGAVDTAELEAWRTLLAERAVYDADPVVEAVRAFNTAMQDRVFYEWPLEAKAQWSQTIRPLVLEKEAESPGYLDPFSVACAQAVYGLPAAGDIAEDEAMALAGEALRAQYGLSEATVALYNYRHTYYDVTDPETPKWRFIFNASGDAWEALYVLNGAKPFPRYKVEIHAQTGEVLLTEAYDPGDGAKGIDLFLQML